MVDLYRRARSPLAWVRLIGGLFAWALAVVLMVNSDLGLGPWDLFHQGVSIHTGLPLGLVVILVGVVILLVTLAMRVWPGPGSLANMVLIGTFINMLMPVLPPVHELPLRLLYLAIGLALVGLGSGLYIGAGMGAGPRDAMMLALSKRLGWSVRRVRTIIELTVLTAGWLLGGRVGVGTILFALLIGPSVQLGLRLCGVKQEQQPVVRELPECAATPGGYS